MPKRRIFWELVPRRDRLSASKTALDRPRLWTPASRRTSSTAHTNHFSLHFSIFVRTLAQFRKPARDGNSAEGVNHRRRVLVSRLHDSNRCCTDERLFLDFVARFTVSCSSKPSVAYMVDDLSPIIQGK